MGASGGQFDRGIALWNVGTSPTTTIVTGGTVGNSDNGVSLVDNDANFGLAGGNSAVKKQPGLVVLLSSADDELALLNRHVELVTREPCHGQRDSQPFGFAVLTQYPLDVIRWIAVGGLAYAIKHALDFIKPKQERTG